MRTQDRPASQNQHGVDAGKLATIIPMNDISKKGCGTPDLGRGHYKPVTKNDRAIRFDNGDLDVHDRGNLIQESR